MNMKGGLAITLLVVVAAVQFTAKPSAASITCSQIDSALAPCISYLTQAGTPSQACCNGVRSIKAMTPNKPDRQMACNCAKQAAGRVRTIRDDAAAALPQKCGVSFGVSVSRNTDCSKV
ncbi:hypothetical protein RHMOL_Rhmol10G0048700 [Rhododendron molle]|uniref:Uncharacterized protein n=1 Tax=Rhododendron molle TaxID=49168 RepID=A0ACC0LZI8_RHOML|nr:hypothetical protein RHMOL_Rhmol10G0048700 [Rhododendron molle]